METGLNFRSNGAGVPRPWDGPKITITAEGEYSVDSSTLPSAACVFIATFVIAKQIKLDVVNRLLELSWPEYAEKMQRAAKEMVEEGQHDGPDIYCLKLPLVRDPHYQIEPTSWPIPSDTRFPFLGKSCKDVFSAWVGNDKASTEQGASPFRTILHTTTADKARYWALRTFVVLDDETMSAANPEEATVAIVYAEPEVDDFENAQVIRCEFPIVLHLILDLDDGRIQLDANYLREFVAGTDGVVRIKDYDAWKAEGSWAEKELLRGEGPWANGP